MGIARMKKVQLFTLRDDLHKASKILQDLSIMEVTGFADGPEGKEDTTNPYLDDIQQQINEFDRKLAEVGRALVFLDQIAPVKPNIVEQFAGVKTYLTPSEFKKLSVQEDRFSQLLQQLHESETGLSRIQNERTKIQTLIDNLTPWEKFDLDFNSLKGTDKVQVLVGSAQLPSAKVKLIFSDLSFPYTFEVLADNNAETFFVLMFEREHYAEIQNVLSKNNVTLVSLPDYGSSVRSKLETLHNELRRLTEEELQAKERVLKFNEERSLLQVFYDIYLSEKVRLEATKQFLHSKRCFGITGWIMADRLNQLEDELNKKKIQYVLNAVEPDEGEQPPTVLRNNSLLTPFEYLVQSFSYPQSYEVDPSPFIAPFFFIFFGIALGDAGYGLILALICAGFLLKLKLGPVGRKISWMFLFSGIGAVLFGLITGSVLSLQNVKFGLFNPLENPILLLMIALGLGLIQLYLGIMISAYYSIREGRWADALWNQGTLLFFLTAAILVLAKDAMGLTAYSQTLIYLFLVAGIGMVIANARGKKGIGGVLLGMLGGLNNIYGTIGFFSDVLSYSRLMALGLSGGVMGGIMNQLAGMVFQSIPVLGWIFGALIFLFGHSLNLALSVLGAYVHSSRLQYLEFFGKFYEGGGKPFTPLKNKQKYTFLISEREA